MGEIWKSPRKVEEELRQYKHDRFEAYMQLADDEVLPRALAITAFKEELDSEIFIVGENTTQSGSVSQG